MVIWFIIRCWESGQTWLNRYWRWYFPFFAFYELLHHAYKATKSDRHRSNQFASKSALGLHDCVCLDQNGHVGTADWQVSSQYFQLPTPTQDTSQNRTNEKIPTICAILVASCFHINIGSSGKRQAVNANDKRVCGGGGYSLELIHHRWLFYHYQLIHYHSNDKAMPGFLSDIRVAERLLARCETNRETVSSLPFEFPTCQRCHFCPPSHTSSLPESNSPPHLNP